MLAIMSASLAFCVLIYKTSTMYARDKIILDLSKKQMSVTEILFPALTVCPQFIDEKLLAKFELQLTVLGSNITDQR